MKGYRVRYTLATKLVNELVEAADEKQLNKTIARYARVDLLCIDELGSMELDRRGAELLFQVLTEREEKNSVAIAPKASFGGWTKTFTDPRLCAAIVDRFTLTAHHHRDRHMVPDSSRLELDQRVARRCGRSEEILQLLQLSNQIRCPFLTPRRGEAQGPDLPCQRGVQVPHQVVYCDLTQKD